MHQHRCGLGIRRDLLEVLINANEVMGDQEEWASKCAEASANIEEILLHLDVPSRAGATYVTRTGRRRERLDDDRWGERNRGGLAPVVVMPHERLPVTVSQE